MRTNRWTMTTVLAGLLLAGSARAGSLTPPSPPGPTMNTLAELYQKLTNSLAEVLATKAEVLANQQRLADLEQRLVTAGSLQPSSGDMVLIPAGSFVMGACTNVGQETIADAVPQHTIQVSAFYMDKYEVRSNLWRDVYNWATNKGYAFANVGTAKTNDHPVQTVNWYDCLAWCNARSQRDGFTRCYTNANGTVYTNSTVAFDGGCNWSVDGYRLPTEAEWEKAARGGVANRRFPWEDANTIQHARANYSATPMSFAYDTSPTTGKHPSSGAYPNTMAAGSFAPNGYGVYDTAGNVWEWCWDWHSSTYYSTSPGTDPTGPTNGTTRVLRGGSWNNASEYQRCACRFNSGPGNAYNYRGFRCVRGL